MNKRYWNKYYSKKNDGRIPSNVVVDFELDSSGGLWMGSSGNGMIRYEKEAFKHYYRDNDDSNSLLYGDVFSLKFDLQGELWIGSQGGLSEYNVDEKKFIHFT